MNITLKEKDLNVSLTDSGQVIDVLALSLKQYTQNELDKVNIDNQHYATDYVIENYDFEACVIDWLNNNPKEMQGEFWQKWADSAQVHKLKAGAWLALNYPEDFASELDNYTEEIKESAINYWDIVEDNIAYELSQLCQEAINEQSEQDYKEWLYGDHQNWAGILTLAEREYNCSGVDYDGQKNELYFEFTDEEVADFIENRYDGEDVEKMNKLFVTGKLTKHIVIELADIINSQAESYVSKCKAEREARSIEYKRVKEYQAEREAEKNAERKAKLLKMTLK